MTSGGVPSRLERGARALGRLRHPSALTIAIAALVVATLGLVVSVVQTHLARQDAEEARRTSTYVVESLARKVFLETDFGSVTVSNLGTQPIHDVTIYSTDAQGRPQAVLEFEHAVPGCWSYRWEGDVTVHVAVGFSVVDEGHWLLSDLTGLHTVDSVPVARQAPESWNLTSSPIKLCA